MKWNQIPFFRDTPPEEKALQFDLQYEENKRNAKEDKSNPYAKDKKSDRRKKK